MRHRCNDGGSPAAGAGAIFGLPFAGENAVDDVGDAVLGLGRAGAFGGGLDVWGGGGHGEAEGGALEHLEVVDVVADGDDAGGVESLAFAEAFDAGPFVDAGAEGFNDLAVEVGRVDGVEGEGVAEGVAEAVGDGRAVGGVDDDGEA